ncbi:MAG: M20/M25/M40 family metallo-hydrolase [Phycisphaerales bacterium]
MRRLLRSACLVRVALAFSVLALSALSLGSFLPSALAVAPGAVADDAPSVIPTIDPARMKANLAELASDEMNGRSFRSEDGKRAADWLAAKLAAAGAKPLEGRDSMLVPVARMPAASPNVVAWIPPAGAKPSGEFILVTAHYDHLPNARSGEDRIYNGADDNASGVCGMIAVAEALHADKLDVGVVFIGFTGEEAGLVGSRAFVEEEILPPARMRGLFNMDMISRQPDGAIRLDGGPKGKVLVDLLVRLAPQVPIEMKVDTHPDWLPRSDQAAFLAAGVPAVLFSCEDHEDYHKVTDHADLCDEQLMARVASLVAGAVRVYAREMSPRFDLSPLSLGDLDAGRRTIRVGRPVANAPYWKPATRRDPNRGLDHDVLEAIATRLKWNIEEKTVAEGGEAEALRTGEVDLIANGFLATDLRRGEFALTTAYFEGSGVGALMKAESPIREASDLDARTIGAVPGGPEAEWTRTAGFAAHVVDATGPIGVRASRVESGEIEALLGDYAVLATRARRDPAVRAALLAPRPTVFALRHADRAVADRIGLEIDALERDGTLAEIRARYGFTTHRVLGQDRGRFVALSPLGTVEWEYPSGHNAHDIAVLGNGNMLLHTAADEVREVTRDGTTVWRWKSQPVPPYAGRVEIHGFQRLANGDTMIAETGNLRIIEVNAKGEIVRSVPIATDRPDSHHDTRRVRKTDAGTYLVCHEPLGLVREYDAMGAIVWEYAVPLAPGRDASPGQQGHGTAVFSALRLANGNTLIGGGNNNRVLEVSPAKEIVWSVGHDELRDLDGRPILLRWVTGVQSLPNGNIVIGNTHGGPDQPQLIEVTRDKKVVWTLRDWRNFGNDLCTGWLLDAPEGTVR